LKFILGLTTAVGEQSHSYPNAVRGFPLQYTGELGFYVVVPAAFALLNVFMFVVARNLPRWISVVVATLQFLLLLVLLFFSTGGV